MKTKNVFMLGVLVMLSMVAYSQVTVEKSKGTLTGKGSLLLESVPESMLDHFTITFSTWVFASDAGGNNAKGTANSVSVEASLENFDNALAQEITDAGYAYFLEQWKSRGINVTCPTAAEIEASKQFAKDKSKGKAEIVNPGVYAGGNNYVKNVTVTPTNTLQVKKDYYGTMVYGNGAFFPGDFTGNLSRVNFNMNINFMDFTAGFGTNASLKGKPALKSTSGSSLVLWIKTKNLAAGYSCEGNGGTDFQDGIDNAGGKWKLKVNREKYKAAAIELVKKSIDSQFAKYDEDLAKEKK